MKKQSFYIISSLLIIALTVTSCFENKSEKNSSETNATEIEQVEVDVVKVEFDKLELNERMYLFPDKDTTNMPFANMEIEFNYPVKFKDEDKLAKLQQIFISPFFNTKPDDSFSPEQALNNYLEDYNKDYKDFKSPYEGERALKLKEYINNYPYFHELQKRNAILFEDNNTLSFTVMNYSYKGGAHGNSYIKYCSIDLDKLTIITEKDIFKPDYHSFLKERLIEQLMKKYNVDTPEKLDDEGFNVSHIEPNNNFWLNKEGLHYLFNEYEIASYVMGQTDVTIPFEDIKSIIIPESIAGKYID